MRATYDAHTDTLSIVLNDRPIVETDEEKPGVLLDYDAGGNIVSLEILDASARVDRPTRMIYELEPKAKSG